MAPPPDMILILDYTKILGILPVSQWKWNWSCFCSIRLWVRALPSHFSSYIYFNFTKSIMGDLNSCTQGGIQALWNNTRHINLCLLCETTYVCVTNFWLPHIFCQDPPLNSDQYFFSLPSTWMIDFNTISIIFQNNVVNPKRTI